MPTPGEGAGAGGGGPRGMGAVGRTGAGARRVARPAPGTAAGGRAIRGAVSTIAQHGTSADNKSTRLGGGRDNGELSDVAQKYGTTQWHGLCGLPQTRTVKCVREMMLFIGT